MLVNRPAVVGYDPGNLASTLQRARHVAIIGRNSRQPLDNLVFLRAVNCNFVSDLGELPGSLI